MYLEVESLKDKIEKETVPQYLTLCWPDAFFPEVFIELGEVRHHGQFGGQFIPGQILTSHQWRDV